MKKLLRHKWKESNDPYAKLNQCQICRCIRYWDFGYDSIMYSWGTHVTYRPPSCLLPNTINYDGKKI